jgi:hypothetical protein
LSWKKSSLRSKKFLEVSNQLLGSRVELSVEQQFSEKLQGV